MVGQPPAAVKSAERVLSILELLTHHRASLTFTEIGQRLGYPRSSLHGLLRTLESRGWVTLDPRARTYSLGIRAWEAAHSYEHAVDLAQRAQPFLERVRDALDETAQLAVLDGRYNVYLAKADGNQLLGLASAVGRRIEAHATGLGKVLLAGLTNEELEERLRGVRLERFTDKTLTTHAALREELDRIRADGYGEDNGEYTVGVHCIAVPVTGEGGRTVAAMSVSIPLVRFGQKQRRHVLNELVDQSRRLSTSLGTPSSSAT